MNIKDDIINQNTNYLAQNLSEIEKTEISSF